MRVSCVSLLATVLLARMATAGTVAPAGSPPTSSFKAVPPNVFDREIVAREMPHLLPNERGAQGAATSGAYMMFVDRTGHAVRVDVIESIPRADDAIIETLRRWTFKPQPVPIRSIVHLVFTDDKTPPAPVSIQGKYRMLSQEQAAKLALSTPKPQLPEAVLRKLAGRSVEGRYVVIVAPSGKVEYVQVEQSIADADEAIIAAVGTWKYSPSSIGLRFVQRFVFDVPSP